MCLSSATTTATATATATRQHVNKRKQLNNDNDLRDRLYDTECLVAKSPLATLETVDLSENNLTDAGVELLVQVLLRNRQAIRRLKLYGNRLYQVDTLCRLIDDEDMGQSQ